MIFGQLVEQEGSSEDRTNQNGIENACSSMKHCSRIRSAPGRSSGPRGQTFPISTIRTGSKNSTACLMMWAWHDLVHTMIYPLSLHDALPISRAHDSYSSRT